MRYEGFMAGPTRLELATSGVTGRRSNQTELRPRSVERRDYSLKPIPGANIGVRQFVTGWGAQRKSGAKGSPGTACRERAQGCPAHLPGWKPGLLGCTTISPTILGTMFDRAADPALSCRSQPCESMAEPELTLRPRSGTPNCLNGRGRFQCYGDRLVRRERR